MAKQVAASILSLVLAATTVNAHAYFHTGYVNGVSQGHLVGVRAPVSNSPIEDVTSSDMACNNPLHQPVSTDVIEVAPGDEFGMQWNHNMDGPTAGDSDDPIAPSHKGPVMVYMAKVDDAATADGAGLQWFKVAQEGLDTSTGTWGVDTLIANKGLWSFEMPSLAPGEYLLRGEILALHSAGSTSGAQFYMSCVGIRVTGSGTCSPSDTVSFPGAYSANDPGVLISIYSNTGNPDNGGKPYTVPGPDVITCDGSSSSPAPSALSSSASVSVNASVTTKNNAASSTSTTNKGVEASSSYRSASASDSSTLSKTTTSQLPELSTTTTTSSSPVLPTTLETVTRSRPAANATRPWESWTWTRPQPSHTRTRPSKASLTSTSSGTGSGSTPVAPTATKDNGHTNGGSGYGNGNGNGHGNTKTSSDVTITASPTETNVSVPSLTSKPVEAAKTSASATDTSPTQPSNTGYSMTGPGGKKFLCYEVTEY